MRLGDEKMMIFDPKTLFYIWSLGSILTILIFLYYSWAYKAKNSSFYIYIIAKSLQFIAFITFANRDLWHSNPIIFFGNLLLCFGFANEIYALKTSVKGFNKFYLILINSITALMLLVFLYFINSDPSLKVLVMSILLGLLFLMGTYLFWKDRQKSSFNKATGFLLFIITISMIVRSINAIYAQHINVLSTNIIQSSVYLSFFIITYIMPILYILSQKELDLKQIREVNKKYHSYITVSKTGAWEYYPDTNTFWCSTEYFAMLGYDNLEEKSDYDIKTQWLNLVHPDDRENAITVFRNYIKANEDTLFENTCRIQKADGEWIWILTRGKLIRYDNLPNKMVGTNIDITRQVNIEFELRKAIEKSEENELYASALFEQSPVSIQIFDKQGLTISVNKAWENIWQTSSDIVINKYNILQDEYAKGLQWTDYIKKAFQGESVEIPINEYDPAQSKNPGRKRILKCMAFPLKVNNEVQRVVMMHEDVTEHFLAQQELEESNKRLMEARNHADNLAILAEKASKAKTEFLANMSHEIRTPLNSVIGFIGLINDSNLNYEQKQFLSNAKTSANTLMEIINDILDLTKIEAGKLELDEVKTDLGLLVEKVVDVIKYNADRKDLNLIVDIQPDIPKYVFIDPLRLKQILINLLNNAIKFTSEGYVQLSLNYNPDPENSEYGSFNFNIKDTGIGIDPSQQIRIFKAFSQADSSTTRKYGGTGLGLVITDSLIKLMGEKLHLESKAGQGSSFSFNLYKRFINEPEKDISKYPAHKKALIIEQEPSMSDYIKKMLEWHGFQTDIYSWNQVINSWSGIYQDYEIVFINQNTDDFDCLSAINQLNTLAQDDNLDYFLILKSSTYFDTAELLKDSSIKHILGKPVKMSELVKCLQLHYHLAISQSEKKEIDYINQNPELNQKYILIVEDVKMNRILLISMIKRIMPEINIMEANNGLEALEKYQDRKPDLVLMDIQMPEMDGYTATRKIREEENITGEHTPILALTAGAVQGDKEKCLEAGMDNYITKPIDFDVLKEALVENILNNSARGMLVFNTEHFNRDGFNQRCGDDPDFYKEIITMSFKQIEEDLLDLQSFILTANHDRIKKYAHRIKGTAVYISANKLMKLALNLENSSELEIPQLNPLFEEIKAEYAVVKSILTRLL